jgi:plasmid maintenance system antidote protein VapI
MKKKVKPVHPGEILREEFIVPLGLSMNRVAIDLRVSVTRIADIRQGETRIVGNVGGERDKANPYNSETQFFVSLSPFYVLTDRHSPKQGGTGCNLNEAIYIYALSSTLPPLGPHNGDYQMLTTDRSDALDQLRSDSGNARHSDSHPAREHPEIILRRESRQSGLDSRNLVALS